MDLSSSEKTKKAWQEFISTGKITGYRINPDIYNSWKRCYGRVDPFMKENTEVLPDKQFKKKLLEHRELIEVSFPILNNIYSFVAGTGFIVTLADKEGYILKMMGCSEAIQFNKKVNYREGANWSEKYVGTSALGLALLIKKPVQVIGAEHYCQHSHNAKCSASPIIDPDTNGIIGVVDMTVVDIQQKQIIHYHTLGMVVAAVKSIQSSISLRRALKNAQIANKYKEIIMDAMYDGVITIDDNKNITHCNEQALRLLSLNNREIIGKTISEVCRDSKGCEQLARVVENEREISDRKIVLNSGTQVSRCLVTTRFLEIDSSKNKIHKIILFQELSRVNQLISQAQVGKAKYTFNDIIGKNAVFKNIIETAQKVAKVNSNVLLMGESGTGKELIAHAIHNDSPRADHLFIAINCSAIPKELLASELFGYEEGAFTGAKKSGNPGKFELANGGTLFLDEIGEMPVELQTYLLRVLEEKAITRVGGNKPIPIDVRIIAATNKDLLREVNEGRFRSDLYYRLNVIALSLPPLRHRKEDIPLLAEHILKKIAASMGKRVEKITPNVLNIFFNYHWPGNVRELQNVLERSVILSSNPVIIKDDILPLELRQKNESIINHAEESETFKLKSFEKAIIKSYLNKFNGNRKIAAKELGIARSTLYRKMEEYNLK